MEDRPEVPEFPVELLVDEPETVTAVERAMVAGGLEHPAVTDFVIDNVGLATWAIEKIVDARATADGIRRKAEEWRARIDQWEADALRPFEATIEFLDVRLRAFGLAERHASPLDKKGEPTVKSIALPNGRIQTTKGRVALAVTNEAELLVWLRANLPDAVRTTEKPLLDVITHHVIVRWDDGAEWGKVLHGDEIVPGIVVMRGADTATVKA